LVRPLEEQEKRESQKLWLPTVIALKDRNHDVATEEKTKVEDQQREEASRRSELGVEWQPRLFRKVRGGPGGSEEGEEDLDWILNADMCVITLHYPKILRNAYYVSDGPTPEAKAKQILAVYPIIKGQLPSNSRHEPPSQHKQPQQHPVDQEDLIDFGRPKQTHAPTQGTSQSNHVVQEHPAPPPLSQQPIQPYIKPPIERLDTETDEVDRFVDAKS
jgi:hypothetical protein